MRYSKVTLGIGITVVAAGCAGCAKIRYPNYYTLHIPAPVTASRTTPPLGPIAVRQFGSPGFLREGSIVYRESPERLGFYHYERWAVDPRREATSAILREMRSRGAFQTVDLYDGSATCDWILSGTLDQLEEVDHGTDVWIEVAISARLKSLRTGAVLWEDTSTKKARVDNRSVPGVVAAMSSEMGKAIESLVTSMLDGVSLRGAQSRAGQ